MADADTKPHVSSATSSISSHENFIHPYIGERFTKKLNKTVIPLFTETQSALSLARGAGKQAPTLSPQPSPFFRPPTIDTLSPTSAMHLVASPRSSSWNFSRAHFNGSRAAASAVDSPRYFGEQADSILAEAEQAAAERQAARDAERRRNAKTCTWQFAAPNASNRSSAVSTPCPPLQGIGTGSPTKHSLLAVPRPKALAGDSWDTRRLQQEKRQKVAPLLRPMTEILAIEAIRDKMILLQRAQEKAAAREAEEAALREKRVQERILKKSKLRLATGVKTARRLSSAMHLVGRGDGEENGGEMVENSTTTSEAAPRIRPGYWSKRDLDAVGGDVFLPEQMSVDDLQLEPPTVRGRRVNERTLSLADSFNVGQSSVPVSDRMKIAKPKPLAAEEADPLEDRFSTLTLRAQARREQARQLGFMYYGKEEFNKIAKAEKERRRLLHVMSTARRIMEQMEEGG